jgi:[histone H3]-trimethyl-L-lysine4 demethylase
VTPYDTVYHLAAPGATAESMECSFWEMVVRRQDWVAKYGSDLPHDLHTPCETADSPAYDASPWSLRRLGKDPGSLLSVLECDIPGINVPWLYAGSLFSSFGWHAEDCGLMSINYLREGRAKFWYGVRPEQASRFEALRDRMGVPDDLRHIIDPGLLEAHGIEVYRAVQQPGAFVVAFPGAYHAGFNLGTNLAEALNLAFADWIPEGRRMAARYSAIRRVPLMPYELVVVAAAAAARGESRDEDEARALLTELRRLADEEEERVRLVTHYR